MYYPALSCRRSNFNPRSPCGERLVSAYRFHNLDTDFNPRSPCGERHTFLLRCARSANFNPRSPCGERLDPEPVDTPLGISIHAPLVGSDTLGLFQDIAAGISIHAPLVGSDDVVREGIKLVSDISIHAPLVGSDKVIASPNNLVFYFNPRSPCGERPLASSAFSASHSFQSTLPLWGATTGRIKRTAAERFQSTLPLWGATK